MINRNIRTQIHILFANILANFAAQVLYFFYLYAGKQSWWISARSFVVMGAVFAVFLAGYILLFRRPKIGYPVLFIFLAVEFLFYLFGEVQSVVHGYGLFFQIHNPDLLLRIIYSIGYLNLFAAGYFLGMLVWKRDEIRAFDIFLLEHKPG